MTEVLQQEAKATSSSLEVSEARRADVPRDFSPQARLLVGQEEKNAATKQLVSRLGLSPEIVAGGLEEVRMLSPRAEQTLAAMLQCLHEQVSVLCLDMVWCKSRECV